MKVREFDGLSSRERECLREALSALFRAVYGVNPSIRETSYATKHDPDIRTPQLHVRAVATAERGAVHGNIMSSSGMRVCYLELIGELHEKLGGDFGDEYDPDQDAWVLDEEGGGR